MTFSWPTGLVAVLVFFCTFNVVLSLRGVPSRWFLMALRDRLGLLAMGQHDEVLCGRFDDSVSVPLASGSHLSGVCNA